MFEQTFKNIDDILHKDAGCTSELDYTEQSSWLLFLKYLDALEQDKTAEAKSEGKAYSFILAEVFRWDSWAAPRIFDGTPDGKLDHNTAVTGDDLRDFVNGRLTPYLAGFKQRASGPNTIEYKIGEDFSEIKNKVQSGYDLRDVIDLVDELRFRSQTEKHELSHLYEAKIKNMGNAGRNGGEYYTPRPLIRAMIQVIAPKIGPRWPRTSPTSRTRTATTWCWPTHPSAASSARRCSRTSRSRPARRPSCSCSTSLKASAPGAGRPSSSRTRS